MWSLLCYSIVCPHTYEHAAGILVPTPPSTFCTAQWRSAVCGHTSRIFLAVHVCITVGDDYMTMHPQSVSLFMYSLAVMSHHVISSEQADVATILCTHMHMNHWHVASGRTLIVLLYNYTAWSLVEFSMHHIGSSLSEGGMLGGYLFTVLANVVYLMQGIFGNMI